MADLLNEYAVLCRQWARAQNHAEHGMRHWRQRCDALEAEVMHLRARLIMVRTALLWRLPLPVVLLTCTVAGRCQEGSPPIEAEPEEVERVLCRVACQSQAHRALAEDGSCRLRGQPCAAQADAPQRATRVGARGQLFD